MEKLIIEIKNLEPLKIGASGSKATQKESSKDYIPGSTLRGALLNKYFQKFSKNPDHRVLYDVCFYNAYPYDESLYIPTPLNIRVDKHQMREAKLNNSVIKLFNHIYYDDYKKDREDYDKEVSASKNKLPYRYIKSKNGEFIGLNLEKTYRLHHRTVKNEFVKMDSKLDSFNKNEDIDRENDNLFRYEAIDIGNIFRTQITFPNIELKNEFVDLINNNTFYLGGSKTSGYGKCEVKIVEDQEIDIGVKRKNDSKILTITCLSDCLFRDKYGLPTNQPDLSDNKLGIKSLIRKFVDYDVTEGYNAKWGARLPKETVVKAGSVFVYELSSQCSDDLINEFENKLHGDKMSEGYGWLKCNIIFPEESKLVDEDIYFKSLEEKARNIIINDQSKKDNENLKIILKGFRNKKNEWIKEIAYRELNEAKSLIISSKVNNNNLTKMMEIIKPEKDNMVSGKELIEKSNYMTDNEKFNFCKSNFGMIYKMLFNKHFEIEIDKYITNKLNSVKGKLFYEEVEGKNANDNKADFLRTLLYNILKLKREGIGNDENTKI